MIGLEDLKIEEPIACVIGECGWTQHANAECPDPERETHWTFYRPDWHEGPYAKAKARKCRHFDV